MWLGSTPFHWPLMLASAITPIGRPYNTANSSNASAQVSARPVLDQTSTPAPEVRDDEAVQRIERDRQRDVDDRDDAGGRVIELLDRLVVDQKRQRDHVLRADEQ